MNNPQNVLARDFNAGQLLAYALPTMLMMVFLGIYTITDTIFVAHYVNTDALAAINIITPLISLVVGLGTMLAAGGNAIISRQLGEGRPRQACENFSLIITVGGALGLTLALLGRLALEPLLRALGASAGLLPYARPYLQILLLFFPAYMLQTIFANLFATAGHPGLGSLLAVGSGLLNIALDYIFIAKCRLGIAGAAWGTGCGYLLPTLVGLIFFSLRRVRRNEPLHFCRTHWRASVVVESCLNGSSEMVAQLATAICVLLFNRTMQKLAGDDGVAAITIMNYAQFLFNSLFIGFSMGVAPIIGYNHGSRNHPRLRRILGYCLRFIAAAEIGVFLLALAGGNLLIHIFAGSQGQVFSLAAAGFKLFAVSFLFCGLNIFCSALFTALSDGRTSALLSFLRTFAFLAPAILLLPRLFGLPGVWLAIPAAELLALCFSLFFLSKFQGFLRTLVHTSHT